MKNYQLPEADMSTLVIGSFRYHLGRMTYAVSEFVGILINLWPTLDENTKRVIERDLESEFEKEKKLQEMYSSRGERMSNSPLGMSIDRDEWLKVRLLYTKD